MQFEPLLMPRLQLPRLQKSLLPRERLLNVLDEVVEHRLTLISGPAGYGKTTLISQWVASRSTRADFPRVASVVLDDGDNDSIRFWRYIIAACEQLAEGCGREALELLLAHRLPPFKPLEMMLTVLLNALSQSGRSGILILDDVHVIRSPQVIESLSFFVDHLPASFHLVLLIRGELPFSVTRLRARNELLDIYPPQFAFSLEETRAFFEQELPYKLSQKNLQQIYKQLEGWVTGLRLLVRTLRWSKSEQESERVLAGFSGSHWSIQDYFLNEVLRTLPEEQQEFLLQTSILPRVSAALCDAITERSNSKKLIEGLHIGDLFLIPLDETGTWNRYHALFADGIQQEARRRFGDEWLQQLALRASKWYEEDGLVAEAIEMALYAAEFPRAARLIRHLLENRREGTTPTSPELYSLNRWLERLPEEELEHYPDLCMHHALTLLFLQMEGTRKNEKRGYIRHLLDVAEQKWRDANKTAELAEVFAFRALLARQEGNVLEAVTWAKQAMAWLPPEEYRWRNVALTVVGVGEMLDGHLNRAYGALLEALALSEEQGNTTYARATRGMLCGASLERGELRHPAEQFRQMQLEARAQEDRDDIARTQLGLASITYQWNKLDEAEMAGQEALVLGEQMNVEEFQALATIRLALVEHARGQMAEAQQRLTAWLVRGNAGRTDRSPLSYQLARQVQATRVLMQLANSDMTEAERWFAGSEGWEGALPLLQQWREQLLHVRLLLARGAMTTAIEQLESLCTDALQTGHTLVQLETQVVLTLAYARQGWHEQARDLLHEVLECTRSEGYIRLFLDEGKEMADLLRELLSHLREKGQIAYVQAILQAFSHEIGVPPPAFEATSSMGFLLEPLSPQEQKVLRLLAAGNSNAEIARELVVSVNTVRTQVQSIYRKLNVNNRVEASSVARQLDLI